MYKQHRPGNVVEDIRAEFDLSPDRVHHVSWLVNHGMLNAQDIRTMLSRDNMLESHGLDVNEWPSLQAQAHAQKGLMQQDREERSRRMPVSHRGEGAIPATSAPLPAPAAPTASTAAALPPRQAPAPPVAEDKQEVEHIHLDVSPWGGG